MNQYPPAPDPSSAPDPTTASAPQHAPYPYQQYGQPSAYGAPGGYPPPSNVPRPRRSAAPLIVAALAVILVVSVIALVVVRAQVASSASGTWYGAGTTGSVGDNAETFKLETYLSLAQSGSTLSGSGELCSVGSSSIPFNVSGAVNGSAVDMTWTLTGGSEGAGSSDTEHVTGQFKSETLTLKSNDSSGYYVSTLKHGSHAAFNSACVSATV